MRWYVVKCKFKMMKTALWNVEEQGFEVFFPLLGALEKGGWKVKAMFPGYFFVSFDTNGTAWRKIAHTRGVSHIMCMDEESPSPMPRGFVEAIQAEQERVTTHKPVDKKFVPGDSLTLLGGPFKGFTGICEMSNRGRVRLLLNLFGASVPVMVPHSGVTLAEESK